MKITLGNTKWIFGMAVWLIACNTPGNKTEFHPVTDTVKINVMKFTPQEITVNKGDTVLWINEGIVSHNITEFPDSSWGSGILDPGKQFRKVFDSSSDYYCSLHPIMKGKVIVKTIEK